MVVILDKKTCEIPDKWGAGGQIRIATCELDSQILLLNFLKANNCLLFSHFPSFDTFWVSSLFQVRGSNPVIVHFSYNCRSNRRQKHSLHTAQDLSPEREDGLWGSQPLPAAKKGSSTPHLAEFLPQPHNSPQQTCEGQLSLVRS